MRLALTTSKAVKAELFAGEAEIYRAPEFCAEIAVEKSSSRKRQLDLSPRL
jgi:hypothetical protein